MLRIALLSLLAAGLVVGCATHSETYVVLPGKEGKVEPLTVTAKAGGSMVLDQPYAAAAGGGRALEALVVDKETIQSRFGSTLAAQPQPPKTFVLYFLEGSDELTPESKVEMGQVQAEIARRPVADVMVVGHTDRVGKVEDNDQLAHKRAEKIRSDLAAQGIPAEAIQAAGRGEREPLVATADEVKEPRNRRVEIVVR